jgi:predicted enzyme related to lactoylglutathione lyase
MPDGRIGHAEIIVAGATIYLADDHPEIDAVGPVGRGSGTTVSLHLTVPSVDSTVTTAVRHRADLERAPTDQPYGRTGVIRDPFGHRWMIQSPVGAPVEPVTPADGDLAFFSLHVPSADRAREFYSAVLGWEFGSLELGNLDQAVNLSLPAGVWDGEAVPGVPNPGVHLVHHVSDVDAAVARVRALGGTATDPEPTPYGARARCTDDQGNGFSVVQTAPGTAAPAANGERAGDLAYITLLPGDEQRAAAFYRGLFGWQFTPGRVEHGLQVQGPMPMAGLWGGQGGQNVSLMYRVNDVAAAVAKVRELGGRQPIRNASRTVSRQTASTIKA